MERISGWRDGFDPDPSQIPNILFKYRDWKDSFHQKVLTDAQVFFAKPMRFNDPMDTAIPFRYDEAELTADNVFIKILKLLRQQFPLKEETELHALAFEYQRKDLLHNDKHLREQYEYQQEQLNKTFGVLSLCNNKNNLLMWSHYANSHAGFCVGFDSALLFNQIGGKLSAVDYEPDFPKFSLFDDSHVNMHKLIYTKAECWKYESEYRHLKGGAADKIFTLKPETISEVIFGCKMTQFEKNEIIELMKRKYPFTRVYEVKTHETKFDLNLLQIM